MTSSLAALASSPVVEIEVTGGGVGSKEKGVEVGVGEGNGIGVRVGVPSAAPVAVARLLRSRATSVAVGLGEASFVAQAVRVKRDKLNNRIIGFMRIDMGVLSVLNSYRTYALRGGTTAEGGLAPQI
jgi:hypothetical protein